MENILEKIVGSILTATPIILLIIKLFAAEYVTQFIKKLFSSKTNKKANQIFNGIVIILLIIGILIILSPYYVENDSNQDIMLTDNQEITPQKSDAEVILEGLNLAYEEVTIGVENKKIKNNEILENRERRMVYQIGDVKDNEKSIINLYNSLKRIKSFDISSIYVFKIKKNSYFLYKDGLFENQLSDSSLTSFKDQIDSVEQYVKIIDLMTNCRVKQTITETDPLKSRKNNFEIRCFICEINR